MSFKYIYFRFSQFVFLIHNNLVENTNIQLQNTEHKSERHASILTIPVTSSNDLWNNILKCPHISHKWGKMGWRKIFQFIHFIYNVYILVYSISKIQKENLLEVALQMFILHLVFYFGSKVQSHLSSSMFKDMNMFLFKNEKGKVLRRCETC